MASFSDTEVQRVRAVSFGGRLGLVGGEVGGSFGCGGSLAVAGRLGEDGSRPLPPLPHRRPAR